MTQAQVQRIVLHAFAVILERLGASGFLGGAGERQIADFEKFRRGEKDHIDGIMIERVAQAALVDHQRAHPRAFCFNGAGQAGGSRSDANQVVCAHESSLPWERLLLQPPAAARIHPGDSRCCNQIFTFCAYNRALVRKSIWQMNP